MPKRQQPALPIVPIANAVTAMFSFHDFCLNLLCPHILLQEESDALSFHTLCRNLQVRILLRLSFRIQTESFQFPN
jgi:hypothetical protein